MKPLPNIDPDSQLARFRKAVEFLGGVRSAARALDCSERTIYGLVYGQRPLHDGWLRDMAAALIKHADECRALERLISPAFAANLTEAQQTTKPHFNRFDRKPSMQSTAEGRTSAAVGQQERKDRNDG